MFPAPSLDPVEVVQVSDPHLQDDPLTSFSWVGDKPARMLDFDLRSPIVPILPDLSLREILSDAVTPTPPDLTVVTGDVAHRGTAAGYERFERMMSTSGLDFRVSPGNHDDHAWWSGSCHWRQNVELGNWFFAVVDTHDPDGPNGLITPQTVLCALDALRESDAEHAWIFLHHPPVDEESHAYLLQVARLVDGDSRFRGMSGGHWHQARTVTAFGLPVHIAPSASVSISSVAPRHQMPPGYLRYRFHANGNVDDQTIWLDRDRWLKPYGRPV